MLLYVKGRAFPHRSLTVRAQPCETIARLRAQLLHILYDIGREDLQFRLRFRGEYLRDAYTLDDYHIMDNAVLTMVSLDTKTDEEDVRSMLSMTSGGESPGLTPAIQGALIREVKHFTHRENIIRDLRTLMNIYGVLLVFLVFTTVWYMFFPCAAIWLVAFLFCPTYTRTTGYIGQISLYKTAFCVCTGILCFLGLGVCVYLGTNEWLKVSYKRCEGDCSPRVYYSGIVYLIQALFLLTADVIIWLLLWNTKIEMGDLVEKQLVQTRDIEEVMKAARKGRVKERRLAAFELATLATSSDDNKFRIVAEGGLDVLLQMAMSGDSATQEHAVETLAELLTIPSIQDTFVTMGGARTLTALLHSPIDKVVYEAALAISYIVSDSEDNKPAVVAHQGLADLCHGAEHGLYASQRVIAGIFLELAFNQAIRAQMTARNSPAKALIALCQSTDTDTQRYALQSLELLAIESSDMICAQESLLPFLLGLPMQTVDEKLYLLAGKILLYFAENRSTCEQIMDYEGVKDMLGHYARSRDPVLQKVIIKVIYCTLEYPELKARGRQLSLDLVLESIKADASDREVWDMADQALQVMRSDEDLSLLPALTTSEQLSRMTGSLASLSSVTSTRKPLV